MFLKSLTLKGFKSFAESATLQFEPGVTVVVGPNGSGKSNIVDAVAWVLGAQGPKTVRSQKMEDVIFAGSSKRPALGRAEVSLTIDNSSHLLPIEFTEVTLTRTLFRNGDSEYAINGVPCRLLDIQDLLSDTGVGRTQHVIVSQGNLDAILNAKPEDRRMVIEEAAGVLKFRRRKEKAERRLEATEANLVRLTDLLREVRRQLRPLERQADAARRHGAVVEELTALRLHLAGREITSLRNRAEQTAATKADLARVEAELRSTLARLDTSVLSAEAALSSTGTGDLADVLSRHESLRERARGLAALVAERRRSAERDRGALLGADVIATLEAEAARISGELREVETEAAALVPMADEVAEAEAGLARERDDFAAQWGADDDESATTTVGGEAAEVRGELAALRSSLERGRTEGSRLDGRLAALAQKDERLAQDEARHRDEELAARDAEPMLVATVDAAGARRATAEQTLADAEAAQRAADAERQEWTARADALSMALDEVRARAGAERLADVDGVVGTLLDLVDVDEGWEAAFEASIGEALAAVVVESPDVARRALRLLKGDETSGAVLALGSPSTGANVGAPLPLLGEPVRHHVRGTREDVDELLDGLLSTAVVVGGGWEQALDVALAHPGVVAVTRDGDRFVGTAWRVGTTAHGATGAALEEAVRRAEVAIDAARAAAERARDAKDGLRIAREEEADAIAAADANAKRLTKASDALSRVEAERGHVSGETETLRSHLSELQERVGREAARTAELEAMLPALEAEEESAAARVVAERSARARIDQRAQAVGALRRDLEVRAAGLEQRRAVLERRSSEIEERLERDKSERVAAEQRRVVIDRNIAHLDRLGGLVADRLAWVDGELAELRERRRLETEAARAATERLEGLRRERVSAERRLEETRERQRRAELDEAEIRLRLEAAVETLRRDYDCEPETAMATECPELPPATSAPNRLRELERELRLMGPINPLALEEFSQLQERHQFLEGQIEDVKSSRRDLSKVIRAIDEEIVNVFRAAYADVSENYTKLFEALFPGGTGRLRLTDPDNLLETGIEIEARPPGKTVRKLSLLSGGERSLTAMAYLFAVFRSRPSPFYLMDEVEAALDDVNLHRFLSLIEEFRQEAQLLVVSHQKRTMEAADCLYGVTMQPGGSTRVVSERVSTSV
ncbi:MAG TPA: chromosome segregation protein SMC [Acidimicrobiales bacterium]|nr:chromosome segregation protein SMC [Acidimicrobiales bacterium]